MALALIPALCSLGPREARGADVSLVEPDDAAVEHLRGTSLQALRDPPGALTIGEVSLPAAAIAVDHAVAGMNRERPQGREALSPGIGGHRRSVMLGTVGDGGRLDGTVAPGLVNVASRVGSLTKESRRTILISDEAVRTLKDPRRFPLEKIGPVPIRGRHGTIDIRTVQARASGDALSHVGAFHAGDAPRRPDGH